MSFSIIAVVGKNRELGKNGKLLWHLPGDLKFFKETTMGHPVLMGHRTFDSLPGLLPGRKHYVLTRNTEIDNAPDQVVLVNNLVDFVDNAPDEEFFVIGGGVSNLGTEFMSNIENKVNGRLKSFEREVSVGQAQLGEFSGVHGVLCLLKNRIGKGWKSI